MFWVFWDPANLGPKWKKHALWMTFEPSARSETALQEHEAHQKGFENVSISLQNSHLVGFCGLFSCSVLLLDFSVSPPCGTFSSTFGLKLKLELLVCFQPAKFKILCMRIHFFLGFDFFFRTLSCTLIEFWGLKVTCSCAPAD